MFTMSGYKVERNGHDRLLFKDIHLGNEGACVASEKPWRSKRIGARRSISGDSRSRGVASLFGSQSGSVFLGSNKLGGEVS